MARARLPAAISDLEGTQPVLRHSPPILPRSMSTTGTPNAAAAAATERPPEPAPITQRSGVKISATPPPSLRNQTKLGKRIGRAGERGARAFCIVIHLPYQRLGARILLLRADARDESD